MMNPSRREFLLGGIAVASAMTVPALSRASDPMKLTIAVSASSYTDMLNQLGQQFTMENPDVSVSFVESAADWDTLLQSTLRGAIVGDLPDGTWQSLTYTTLLAKNTVAQPLDDLSGGVSQLAALGLSQALVEGSSSRGHIYAIPFGTTIPVIYYNMDLLHRAGYSAATPPATWDEIIAIGKKVATIDPKISGGYFEYDATNAWMFQNLVATHGGRMMNPEQSDIAFDGPEGQAALDVLSRFGDTSTVDMTRDQARQAFNAGSMGMLVRSASGTTSVAKAAKGHFELQVGLLPVPSAEGRLVGAGHGFMMFAKDAHKQEALWRFMKFAAGPKGQMILAKNTGYMPVNILALKDPKFLKQYLSINPYHRAIVEQLAITGDQFSFPSANTVKITDMIAAEMRGVVVHQETAKQALATMASTARELLKSA